MGVLEQEQHGPLVRQILELTDERRKDPFPLLSRIVGQRRIAPARRHCKQVRKGSPYFRGVVA